MTFHILWDFLFRHCYFSIWAHVILYSSAREIQSQGDRVCGTYVGMMSLAILFGTGIQLVMSLIAQFILHQA